MKRTTNLIRNIEVAGPEMARNVVHMLGDGLNLKQACWRAKCSVDAFMARVQEDKGLRRALASKMILGAWDRVEEACRDNSNPTILSTYAKLSADIASKLAPEDWGDKVQIEQTKLVINTNLDFGVVAGFDAAVREAGTVIEVDATEAEATEDDE